MHYSYAWKALENILIKIFFGPWLYVDSTIMKFHDQELPHRFFWALTLLSVLVGLFIAARISARKRVGDEAPTNLFLRISLVVLTVLLLIGITGSAFNVVAIVFNDFSMPAGYEYKNARVAFLADHIPNDSSRLMRFLFKPNWWFSSPGDLMIAAWFILSWWMGLVLLGFAAWQGIRKTHRFFCKLALGA